MRRVTRKKIAVDINFDVYSRVWGSDEQGHGGSSAERVVGGGLFFLRHFPCRCEFVSRSREFVGGKADMHVCACKIIV